MHNNKAIWLLFFSFLCIQILHGQDPVFTSFMQNPLYYNPATPGIQPGNEFHVNYREQWPGLPAGNRAYDYASTHTFCNNFSLGLIALSNLEGESRIRTTNIGLSIAVPISISKYTRLSTGITTAYGQKRIDWSQLEFDDQYDKLWGKMYPTNFPFPDNSRKNYGDLSFGIAFQGSTKERPFNPQLVGIVGAAFHHAAVFPNPNFLGSTINAVPFKQVYHSNAWILFGRDKDRGISPALMYEKQGSMETFNFSLSYMIQDFYVLGGFRNRNYKLSVDHYDSFLLGVGFISADDLINSNSFKIGYSYDFTVSKLAGGAYGTHEIFMVYKIDRCLGSPFNRKNKKYNVKRPDKECNDNMFRKQPLYW
ncbi:MAG: PorP/SprF family type IX secretion system membrane protein [Bacteroidales bacterium]